MRVITTVVGDRLEVGIAPRFTGEPRTVRIGDIELEPDTARRAAVALIEGAAEAERRSRKESSG